MHNPFSHEHEKHEEHHHEKPMSSNSFIRRLQEIKLLETVGAFIASGFFIFEVVHMVLVQHYHLPEELTDVTLTSTFGALISTIIWRLFHHYHKPGTKIKIELILVPIVLSATLFFDVKYLIEPSEHNEGEDGTEEVTENRASVHHGKEVPSIAFLYLKNLGTDQDESFCYGITEDLIVDIAKAGLVRVAPMNDIMSIQKERLTSEAIAKKLRVRYIMEGSFRRDGNFARITATIIDALTKNTLWADRIETSTEDAASLQGKLAKTILTVLDLKPSETIEKEITTKKSANPQAYEYYLRAKFLYDKKKMKDDVAVARGLYEQAISMDPSFVLAQLGLGATYELEGKYERALKMYNNTLSIAKSSNSEIDLGNCLRNIGIVYNDLGDFSKALDFYNQSLSIMQKLGDKKGEGNSLRDIGLTYLSQGNYPPSLDYFTKSLKICEELGEERDEGVTLSNIGIVYMSQGDYSKALEKYSKSLKISQELEDREGEGNTLINIGYAYNNQGYYKESLEYYAQSLKIKEELGNKEGEGIILNNIATVYNNQGDYTKAMENCNKSFAITQSIGDRSGDGYNYVLFGQISYSKQDFSKATDYFKKAEATFTQTDEKQNVMWANSWRSLSEIKLGNRNDANTSIKKVEELFKAIPHPENIIEICWNLSQTYTLLSNTDKASEYLRKANDEVQSSATKISDTEMKQSFLSKVKVNKEIIAEITKGIN